MCVCVCVCVYIYIYMYIHIYIYTHTHTHTHKYKGVLRVQYIDGRGGVIGLTKPHGSSTWIYINRARYVVVISLTSLHRWRDRCPPAHFPVGLFSSWRLCECVLHCNTGTVL